MDVRQEIARRVEKLPPESQEQVLRFAASLPASAPAGEKGADLRQFASSIDSVSAGQMVQAIEEECERIDAGDLVVRARASRPAPLPSEPMRPSRCEGDDRNGETDRGFGDGVYPRLSIPVSSPRLAWRAATHGWPASTVPRPS